MANAFDFANIGLLAMISYARDTYGEELTLDELADTIDASAEEHFATNEVSEQDQTVSLFCAGGISAMLRELANSGYILEDMSNSIQAVVDEDAFAELNAEEDDEEEEELDEEDDEDDEEGDDLDEEDDEDAEEEEEDEEELDDEEEEELDEEDEDDLDDEEDEDVDY